MGVQTKALKSLNLAWQTKTREMQRLNQGTKVRPFEPQRVIRVAGPVKPGIVRLDCGPAVFELYERANRKTKMYVVVQGSICIQQSSEGDWPLQTTCFGTKVGYFRSRPNQLEHVYGVHYDMDERGDGHPVFHAQLRPMMQFEPTIQQQFGPKPKAVDHVGRILRNVRTPTAQMDFFSVVTQLCADHLMDVESAGSDPQVTEAFNRVRMACKCLQGAAHRLSYLYSGGASKCYRSSHWYCGP